MVFEAIVVDLLNKFLNQYIENLDTSQLKIGIWGGDVVLADLHIKQTIFKDLNLPFKVLYGKLGKLVLKIPWKNLYGESTTAMVENLLLVLVPNTEIRYNEEKEEKWAQDKKQHQLKMVEDAKKRELEKDKPKPNDTFIEKLAIQVVKTIQIEIKNIHIRYEDRTTNPDYPFSVGATMYNLSLTSTTKDPFPEEYQGKSFYSELIYKIIKLDGLAIYWNTRDQLISGYKESDMEHYLLNNIPSLTYKPGHLKYIIGPIIAKGSLRLNPKPELDGTDYEIPKVFILIDMESIKLAVSRRQYKSITSLLQNLQRLQAASKFRKYKPFDVPVIGNAKEWWRFAYAGVSEDIKRRKKEWSWDHIKAHREMCRKYASLYYSKITAKKVPQQVEKDLTYLEKKLSVFNLILLREQVYVDIEREKVLAESEPKTTTSWFSFFFSPGTSSRSEEKEDLATKLEKVMTGKEKEKLYKAIDYQENYIKTIYPEYFVEFKFMFKLNALTIRVYEDKQVQDRTTAVLASSIRDVQVSFEQRPSASAIGFKVILGDFNVLGKSSPDQDPPILVKSNCEKFEKLIDFVFETNPLYENCDQRIHVTANPLVIIYHADTINGLRDIFLPGSEEKVPQIVVATASSLPTFQEITAIGLQYAIDQSSKLEVRAHILASSIIIPYGGNYDLNKDFVLLRLGQLDIMTEEMLPNNISVRKLYMESQSEQDIFSTMLSASYRKFNCQLQGMQILHRLAGEEWQHVLEDKKPSPLRLLEPTDLTIVVKKCLVTDDARIPKAVVEGKLPSITLNVSENRIICLAGLASSIPTGVPESEPINKGLSASAWSLQSFGNTLEPKYRPKVSKPNAANQDFVQGINLVARFQMNKFVVVVSKLKTSPGVSSKEVTNAPSASLENFMNLNILNLKCELTSKTFETLAEVKLGAIEVKQHHKSKVLPVIQTSGQDRDYLFLVLYENVDKKIPDFFSKRGGVVTTLKLSISSLDVILHKEAILNHLEFVSLLLTRLEEVKAIETSKMAETVTRKMANIFEEGTDVPQFEKKIVSKGKKFRKKRKANEVIDLVVEVIMNSLNIRLESDERALTQLSVKGGEINLSTKKSFTNIDCRLCDLYVLDLNKETKHDKIVSTVDKQTLSFRATLFNSDYLTAEDSVDVSFEAEIGRVRCIFLHSFINTALEFANAFQKETARLKQGATVAAHKAKEGVIKAYENETRISLNIKITAPLIVFPRTNKSMEVIVMDMGILTVKSFITELEDSRALESNDERQKNAPLMDLIRCHLENVKLTRAVLNPRTMQAEFEKTILDPFTLELTVQRNLSFSWYKDMVHLQIQGRLELIHITLSHTDLCMMIHALRDNYAEGQPEALSTAEEIAPLADALEEELKRLSLSKGEIDEEKAKSSESLQPLMVFQFSTDRFLFDTVFDSNDPLEEESYTLSKFVLEALAVKGSMFSDGSMTTTAFLSDITVDDTRPAMEGRITRLMGRKADVDQRATNPAMLNMNIQKRQLDSFVDVRVYGFNLILSMDFISKLLKFFTVDDDPPPSQIKSTEQKRLKPLIKQHRHSSIRDKKIKGKKEEIDVETLPTFTVNIRLEKPDIAIVESMDSIDTDALIFNTELILKYRCKGTRQVITSTLSDIGLVSCCFNPFKRPQTISQIVKPFTISLAGSTPEGQGLHVDICLTEIYLAINAVTVELISQCYKTLMSDPAKDEESAVAPDYSDLWKIKPYSDEDYWFLRTEEGVDALSTINKPAVSEILEEPHLEQICLMSIPTIVITIEDVSVKTKQPLLLLEMSFQGQIHNWSSQFTLDSLIKLQMQYFNKSLSAWEPFIEPLEVTRDNKTYFTPWELDCNVTLSNDSSEVESGSSNMNVVISCSEKFEITITKTCMEVFGTLADAFSSAVSRTGPPTKRVEYPPFIVKNELGSSVELLLDKSNFKLCNKKKESYKVIRLDPGSQVELEESMKHQKMSAGSKKLGDTGPLSLHVKSSLFELGQMKMSVTRTAKRFFPIKDVGATKGDNCGMILDVNIKHTTQIITLRGILQVHNHFQDAIDVHYLLGSSDEIEHIGTVDGNSVLALPIHSIYTPEKQLFFSLNGYTISMQSLVWKDIELEVGMSVRMQCNSKNPEDSDPFFIMAVGEVEQVYFENTTRRTMSSLCINIHLQPTLEILNCLPVDLNICPQGSSFEKTVPPGDTFQVTHAEPGMSMLALRIENYLEKEWSCKEFVEAAPPEFSVWTFTSYSGLSPETLNVGILSSLKRSCIVFTVYSPYLVVNQTGLMISYRFDDNSTTLFHPPNYTKPMMFSPGAKKFFSKKKALLKVNNGDWSDKFSVDVAGSGGSVECYDPNSKIRYLIATTITLTFNNLTKIVMLTPNFVILNKTNFIIECMEDDVADANWIRIQPAACVPFWPVSQEKRKSIFLRVADTNEETPSFYYDSTDSILLKLHNNYGGLFVDLQTTNSGTNIIINPYEPGLSPSVILNHTNEPLQFWENKNQSLFNLEPREMCHYTWSAPKDERKLTVVGEKNKEYQFSLREDTEGTIALGFKELKYISFLDGTQRVLLFTEDSSVAFDTKLAGRLEDPGMEVTFRIQGIGLSLVNNVRQVEILYMGFVSSGITWETKKENRSRYKPVGHKDSFAIENAYQKYLETSAVDNTADSVVVIDNKIQVNFETMELLYPDKKQLRRVFEPGLWIAYKTSPSYITLHMKINKIQIDNQLHDNIFPIIFCPVPPPKTIAVSQGPKPFFEMSILKIKSGQSGIEQFKYFKVLIQEFSVRIDIGFVTEIWSFITKDEYSDDVIKAKFKKDIEYCEEPLLSHVTVSSTSEQKNFYDLVHFTPIKVHVSFSLAGNVELGALPPALSVLLQSLGVTLTDLHDVLFRLSYFERKSAFITRGQLQNEVVRHYYGQAIRQAYVLLLGLDVIGNPFGLVIGIGQGVEAFFYEPVQGIIQGPSDFAQGIALGCKSLFGHTVGGTAGTLGRLTGTLGKGLAVLSLDKEYQRQRMAQQNKRSDNISASMAQGGRGVFMGVYEGVTGVVMKPLSGAKEEGVGGFFKGVGKGMMGLVTRPVTGVVDFASTSLIAVKRATEASAECRKLRPPRFFHDDKLITPYRLHESTGYNILYELEKKKYCKTDKYEYHAYLKEREVVLLTDKRLLLTEFSDVFGHWHVHLEITWAEMVSGPRDHHKGVAITIPNKKTFQTSTSNKVLVVDDRRVKETLMKKMEELYGLEHKKSP